MASETKCDCPEWADGIEKVNGPIVMQTLRSGGAYHYDGSPFRFCPWCGRKLATTDSTPGAAPPPAAGGET